MKGNHDSVCLLLGHHSTEMHCKTGPVIVLLLSSLLPTVSGKHQSSTIQGICEGFGLDEETCCYADKFTTFVGYGTAAAAVGTYGVPFALAQIGFTSAGVIGGSFAALWQSTGMLPGLFAYLQSASMTGTAAGFVSKAGGLVAFGKSVLKTCKKQEKEKKTWY